jgi:hypothetical protein
MGIALAPFGGILDRDQAARGQRVGHGQAGLKRQRGNGLAAVVRVADRVQSHKVLPVGVGHRQKAAVGMQRVHGAIYDDFGHLGGGDGHRQARGQLQQP